MVNPSPKQRMNELRSNIMQLELQVGWWGQVWLWFGLPGLTSDQIALRNARSELKIYEELNK